MFKIILIITALAAAAVVVAGAVLFILNARPLTPAQAEERIASLLERTVRRDGRILHGVTLVDAPEHGISLIRTDGPAFLGEDRPLTRETPFASASIGKLFTAAAVLDMEREGLLTLDDPLDSWLGPDILDKLPVEGGREAAARITLRQLLGHRSGLPDYFEKDAPDGAPSLAALVFSEPDRTWNAEALLSYTGAHWPPAGAPGEVFHYADTNYDLLGLVMEAAAGRPWYRSVRERVLEPAGLTASWYHAFEDPPAPDVRMASLLFDGVDLSVLPSRSFDGAGGGLAVTAADLRTFMRGLQRGNPVSLEDFSPDWTRNTHSPGIDYGLALWRIRPAGLSPFLRNLPEMYGVSGSTGSYVYLVPEWNAVLTGTFDRSGYNQGHVMFLVRVLGILGRVRKGQAG